MPRDNGENSVENNGEKMRISRTWLSDFVDLSGLSNDDYAELITTRVAEVDRLEPVALPVSDAVVALVKAVTPLRGNLNKVLLSLGSDEVVVVCGAENCQPGILVPFIPKGGKVVTAAESPLQIVTEREISGTLSIGVIPSEFELGLTGDHSGVLILGDAQAPSSGLTKVQPGVKLAQVVGEPDCVLVIDNKSLTHRPDLWGHYGFARELSAILGRSLRVTADDWADDTEAGMKRLAALGDAEGAREGDREGRWKISIQPKTNCRRFMALELEGICLEASPLWLRRRLFSVGAGVRNLIVDLSNYVMHDVGQPNHVYDADLLVPGTIQVRLAKEGEHFLGLDDQARTLRSSDVVIADQKQAVALGGILGGKESSVRPTTKRVLLESGNFEPVSVRLTAKHHQLRTDASNRFEKSQSPYSCPLAIWRFSELLMQVQKTVKISAKVAQDFPYRPKPIVIPVTGDFIRRSLGVSLEDREVERILSSLRLTPMKEERMKGESQGGAGGQEQYLVSVPYYRSTRDISIPEDLVEEVGRIYGYENVPEQVPLIESSCPRTYLTYRVETQLREALVGLGFSETYGYSFMDAGFAESLGYPRKLAVQLMNPIDANLEYMRTSLVPGMIKCVNENGRYTDNIALFEFGRGYETEANKTHATLRFRAPINRPAAFERRLLCLGYVGSPADGGESCLPPVVKGAGFYALLSVLKRLALLVTGEELVVDPFVGSKESASDFLCLRDWMHPYRAASLNLAGRTVGAIAEVRPGVFDTSIPHGVVSEIDIELLMEGTSATKHFEPISRFPESFFEMSVVMSVARPYRDLETYVRNKVASRYPSSQLLRKLEVIAVYTGKPLQANEKSVSIKLFLGAQDRTLSGDELASIQTALVDGLGTEKFALRS